ncbi:hypothetical protein UlMin_009020 [Ulmus minor]
MDQNTHEGRKQNGDEKSSSLDPVPLKKPGVVENENLEANIACPTPQKIYEPLHNKSLEGQVNLPEKYRAIAEFFDRMNCSLKLLGLYKRLPTFQNVATQMAVLTKRNFTYKHLAQIKYILPEALQIDKILTHDQKTLCMKPDMLITLLFDVVEGHSQVSDDIALRKVFALRLYKFLTTHLEASDVPEAILPEPFTQKGQIYVQDQLLVDGFIESQSTSTEAEPFPEKLIVKACFSRHFSKNTVVAEKEKTKVLLSTVLPPSISSLHEQVRQLTQLNEFPDPFAVSSCNQDTKSGQPKESLTDSQLQPNYSQCSVGTSTVESPLVNPTSCGDSFMIETPAKMEQRRSISSCDMTHNVTISMPARRGLQFSHSEGDTSELDFVTDKSMSNFYNEVYQGTLQQNQTGEKVDQSTSCLVDMVYVIHSIFKSVNYSPVTKEELVYKIIVNSFDVVEKGEVEEQIDLLGKLVPDWIYSRLAPSGDIMYSIKVVSDLDSVRAKLLGV